MEKQPPVSTGDFLYHNTARSLKNFCPQQENVVYFGLTPESITYIGEEGYQVVYQLIDELPQQGEYGDRFRWGFNNTNNWLSMPSEVAAEILQHIETKEL